MRESDRQTHRLTATPRNGQTKRERVSMMDKDRDKQTDGQ